jgi:phosphohistidine phosphatase
MSKRTLLIMRHAKSSWDDHDLPDFDRPLNKRGSKDAPEMGKRLKKQDYACDLLIASPAARAKATALAVAEQIGYSERDIIWDRSLYLAEVEDYLDVIAHVDENVRQLMIVSHNPGSEMLIEALAGETFEKFPTAAYALLEVEGSWQQPKRCRLIAYDYPKSVKA